MLQKYLQFYFHENCHLDFRIICLSEKEYKNLRPFLDFFDIFFLISLQYGLEG